MGSRSKETTRVVGNTQKIEQKEMPMIEVVNLHKNFGDKEVLRGMSFQIFKGETACVIGGSGGGKSTLLKCVIGAIKPTKGKIFIGGTETARIKESKLNQVRKRFGVLFQSAALFNSMSVYDNIALPLRHHTDLPEETIKLLVKAKLELVELQNIEHMFPAQLSGGMKKRVGLARAIALDPEIIFFDEPNAGLDPIVATTVDNLIIDLTKKLRITSFVVTHDMHSAFRISDKIIMLHQGKIAKVGTPEEFKNSNDPIVLQFISGGNKDNVESRFDLIK